MEFNFIISKLIPLDSQGIGVYEGTSNRHRQLADAESNLSTLINVMGERSATAQSLKQVITRYEKMQSGGQKLYVAADGRTCQGILKVGYKNLFYRDMSGNVKEIKPLCVLDFYVHENCQRQGYGKILFEAMLQRERTSPEFLAYDRPSPKLIGFLRKHYGLVKYVQQNNNFVVFDAYFKSAAGGLTVNHNANNLDQYSHSHRSNSSLQNIPQQSNYGSTFRNNQVVDSLASGYQSQSKQQQYLQQQQQQQQQQTQLSPQIGRSLDQVPNQRQQPQQLQHQVNELAKAGRAVLSTEDTYRQSLENSVRSKQSQSQDIIWDLKPKPSQQLQQQHHQSYSTQDRKLDKIQQRILQTEKEIDSVNQQIERQRQNLKQAPAIQNSYSQQKTSPLWSNTGLNYYQTSSQHYGNHYTYYGK